MNQIVRTFRAQEIGADAIIEINEIAILKNDSTLNEKKFIKTNISFETKNGMRVNSKGEGIFEIVQTGKNYQEIE